MPTCRFAWGEPTYSRSVTLLYLTAANVVIITRRDSTKPLTRAVGVCLQASVLRLVSDSIIGGSEFLEVKNDGSLVESRSHAHHRKGWNDKRRLASIDGTPLPTDVILIQPPCVDPSICCNKINNLSTDELTSSSRSRFKWHISRTLSNFLWAYRGIWKPPFYHTIDLATKTELHPKPRSFHKLLAMTCELFSCQFEDHTDAKNSENWLPEYAPSRQMLTFKNNWDILHPSLPDRYCIFACLRSARSWRRKDNTLPTFWNRGSPTWAWASNPCVDDKEVHSLVLYYSFAIIALGWCLSCCACHVERQSIEINCNPWKCSAKVSSLLHPRLFTFCPT